MVSDVVVTASDVGTQHTLQQTTLRRVFLSLKQVTRQHWTGLKMQVKPAALNFGDHWVSHSMYRNSAVGEDIRCFTVKARLQV